MAFLAASDVTVTLTPQGQDFLGKSRVSSPSVTFGNGVLQYPALGVPMPALGYFGMKKAIVRVFIEQPANGFIYHFDRTNHKVRIFNGAGVGTITVANHVNIAVPAPANHSHDLIIAANTQGAADIDVGVNEANLALVSNTANAATIAGGNATRGGVQEGAVPTPANLANLTHTVSGGSAAGALVEMAAGVAPAAATLYMTIIGQ